MFMLCLCPLFAAPSPFVHTCAWLTHVCLCMPDAYEAALADVRRAAHVTNMRERRRVFLTLLESEVACPAASLLKSPNGLREAAGRLLGGAEGAIVEGLVNFFEIQQKHDTVCMWTLPMAYLTELSAKRQSKVLEGLGLICVRGEDTEGEALVWEVRESVSDASLKGICEVVGGRARGGQAVCRPAGEVVVGKKVGSLRVGQQRVNRGGEWDERRRCCVIL